MRLRGRNVPIELTAREVAHAWLAAQQREDGAQRAGARPVITRPADSLRNNFTGCAGELAAAKGLDRYWTGGGTDWRSDQDLGVAQVRTVTKPHADLVLRPRDALRASIDAPWILVSQRSESLYTLVGWIVGSAGLQIGTVKDPGGYGRATFVEQWQLRPFEELDFDAFDYLLPYV